MLSMVCDTPGSFRCSDSTAMHRQFDTSGYTPGFSQAGIVPDDAAGRRVFSVISRYSRPCIQALFSYLPCFTLIGSQDLNKLDSRRVNITRIDESRRRVPEPRLAARTAPAAAHLLGTGPSQASRPIAKAPHSFALDENRKLLKTSTAQDNRVIPVSAKPSLETSAIFVSWRRARTHFRRHLYFLDSIHQWVTSNSSEVWPAEVPPSVYSSNAVSQSMPGNFTRQLAVQPLRRLQQHAVGSRTQGLFPEPRTANQRTIWTALNIEVLRADEGARGGYGAAWSGGAGGTGDPRENPPTNGIVRHDSHMPKCALTRPGIESGSPWLEANRITAQPPWHPSIHGYLESRCLQFVPQLLKGTWRRRQTANPAIEVVPQMFNWIEIGAVWGPWRNFEFLIVLLQPCADTSSRVVRRIIVLEDPILPRKDNHRVRMEVISEDGFIIKSIRSAFHRDDGT
ncbi:hypothetical protein PR048_006046 [Dryococelus australis]|uniref:Uncharacterized protein n=1 Tax=Dryococelus australis TaxID=614101 RepID=A0ABQ9I9W0_9NEOP|nr:hypothetical protein PR048_006046 [Dryococelus australis]